MFFTITAELLQEVIGVSIQVSTRFRRSSKILVVYIKTVLPPCNPYVGVTLALLYLSLALQTRYACKLYPEKPHSYRPTAIYSYTM